MAANNSSAVMARRNEPTDSLDFFPTPPWATRALFEFVLKRSPHYIAGQRAWEPAAGEGHMAEVLREFFADVFASDIHDYGRGYVVGDYLGTLLRSECPFPPDWVISNPPFNEAADFLSRALAEAKSGVALLLRLSWLEGAERWREIFRHTPPTTVAVFAGRVAMVKGKWDPGASSATAYAWFIWNFQEKQHKALSWIPPTAQQELTSPDDMERFATYAASSAPLLDGPHE